MSWKPSTYLAGTPTLPASVEVASTATTIAGPFDVVGGTYAEVALTNTDGSQTLNAWVESSPDGTTWNAKLNWQGLDAIAAGELRYEGFDCTYERHVRIRGTASGAGLTSTIFMAIYTR